MVLCYVKLRSHVFSFEVEELILCGRLRAFICGVHVYLFTTGKFDVPGLKSFARCVNIKICRDDVADQNIFEAV